MRIELPTGTAASLTLPEAAADLTPDVVQSDQPVLSTSGPGPSRRGVVVIPDIGGLRPLFDDLCARLTADHGWAACAFEPFPGQEDELAGDLEKRFAAVPHLRDERLLGDAVHAAELLSSRGGCDRVAVLGFCMGGMYTFKAAGTGRFDRAVAFYGMIRLPDTWRGPGQGEPLAALARPDAARVLAILGGRDPYTPAADIAELERLPNVEAVVYPDAEHGFVHDPTRPSHRADDAADAWRRVAAFLA